ncbi:glycoside hydrolase family 32 protein [Sporolactobacillus laevolacticus]|uniref:glycoside hydrolase family 32 protein n=1 Tax=Sporolactobacillus laevolacticus TaxID=33018 RepID=UPI0025B525A1|nr:glycoside hydrolase family 32 protein [Sporolactobacillus laevolacticus]MDN3956599.1 glycoside hydrolase family 32 protein [Sporolactobacillus laevolacticus]
MALENQQTNTKIDNETQTAKRWRLGYHIMAPSGWINDPNGLIQYKGNYHVFFQHYPYGVEWGPMHWGHVASHDLVHWKYYPIALVPGDTYDRDGCFSGSAVEDEGELCLIYTGHRYLDKEKSLADQVQCLAVSRDGIQFTKDSNNPVIASYPEEGSGDFRDPKVWRHNDFWYLIAGTTKNHIGKVVLYRSSDLRTWTYLGVIAQSEGNQGYMWECPDFFELNGKHILMISPQGIEPEDDCYQNLHQTGYFVGHFDDECFDFSHGSFNELDKGHDFYAVQTFQDDQGRRIAFAWMDMWESLMPEQEEGWAGALTLPRELTLAADGKIRMKPVEELKKLRKDKLLSVENEYISGEKTYHELTDELLEIEVEFDTTLVEAFDFGIKLRIGETEETVIRYDPKGEKLILDRTKSGTGVGGVRQTALPKSERLRLHIYLDRSSVEVFANDGETVMTSRMYPTEKNEGVRLFSNEGDVRMTRLNVWRLENIGLNFENK